MRAKKFNGKLVHFSKPQWVSIVKRFDWEKREYRTDEHGNEIGYIPSGSCVLCICHSNMKGDCGDCPLDQFKVGIVGCFDSPGCFVAIDTLLGMHDLGKRCFRSGQPDVMWRVYDDAKAKQQIQLIYAYLLSMDSVTYHQLKKMRR